MTKKKRKKPSRTLTGIYGSGPPKRKKVKRRTQKKRPTSNPLTKKNLGKAKKFLGGLQKEVNKFELGR